MLADPGCNAVTREIVGAAIAVHRELGPGLLESVYLSCLQHELSERRVRWTAQRSLPINYRGLQLEAGYRIDLLVEDLVVVEIKSVERVLPVHHAQLLTYLRLLQCPAGLLINFNVVRLLDGLRRILNTRTGAAR